jgi:hypothetical protein
VSDLGSRISSRARRSIPLSVYLSTRRRYYAAQSLVGRNPGRGRLLPDFIIIGAAKSGTTSLYGALTDHPFVLPCTTTDPHFENTKEIHYFSYGFQRGEDWYRSHFPLESTRREFEAEHGRPCLTGEASPSYISSYWAPGRVREVLPDVRLVAVLRNPVDRAYSQFQMSRRQGLEPLERFEDATAAEEERLRPEVARLSAEPHYNSLDFGRWSYLARSRYAEQLERWLALFPREQFLFLKAEELFADPETALAETYDHLGLPPYRPEGVSRLNAAQYAAIEPDVRAQYTEYFRPHNERLYELVGIDFGWERDATPAAV